jgi:hypothetical protein
MVRRALLKSLRGLCLVSFYILVSAAVIAILELITLFALALVKRPVLGKACGMTEIVPMFSCGHGWIAHSIEFVLNLPFLFSYALAFTVFGGPALNRSFIDFLYIFDVIFALGVVYFLVWFLNWSEVRHRR